MELEPAGPFGTFERAGQPGVPWYVMPFDEGGRPQAPQTLEHLSNALARGRFTDVFLFSHGWNNTWPAAIERYEDFIDGFVGLREKHSLSAPDPYRPVLVGVFWPSATLVGAAEQAPQMAAGGSKQAAEIAELAEAVDPAKRARLVQLLEEDELDAAASLELATILGDIYEPGHDEVPDDDPISPDDIVAMWTAGATSQPGAIDEEEAIAALKRPGSAARADGLQAAGRVGLKTRDVLRLTSLWRMKDRAAVVGGGGVSDLLADLLGVKEARFHLIGHSFGAKVLLSALEGIPQGARNVRSMLLLQPAVSHLCFAPTLPKRKGSGGYLRVPARVELPIMSTYSKHDVPLHKMFHLALRRRRDLGEQKIAAPGAPPSIHAALGGYGPRGLDEVTDYIDVRTPTERYNLTSGAELIAIDGSEQIGHHGDVSNEATWWMLHNFVMEETSR